MKATKNRRGDDAVAFANPMTADHRCDLRAIRNARTQARVWTPTIAARHHSARTLRTWRSFNGITKSRHSRRIVPISRSQNALAWGARTGVLSVHVPRAPERAAPRMHDLVGAAAGGG